MITLLLAAVIELSDVRAALTHIDRFCAVLKCPKPIIVSIWPDAKMPGMGGSTQRIKDGPGCAIHLRREALFRVDILAHEACHCANDYESLGKKVSDAKRAREEEAAVKCSQELLERDIHTRSGTWVVR